MSAVNGFETVHCILDWYDGPVQGVANFRGAPHVFERESLDDGSESATYLLSPMEASLMPLVMEDWAIWLRWEAAFQAGQASIESHPALPEERARHEELERLLGGRVRVVQGTATRARAEFKVVGGAGEPVGQFRVHTVRWA